MPPLADDDFAALKEDIKANGLLIPVEVDEDGNVLDGHHRVRACTELGIEWRGTWKVREGLTEAEKRRHALTLNIRRRHLTGEQKRELVAQQLVDAPERSDRSIAKDVGVSDHTVNAVRKKMVATAQIAQLDKTVGKDGKERPASKPKATRKPKAAASALAATPADPAPAAAPPILCLPPRRSTRSSRRWSRATSRRRSSRCPVGTQPGPKPEPESLDHRDGRTTQAPALCHRFLAAAQSYADVLQEISDGPEDADPFAGLNDEELALFRAAYSRIKKIVAELPLAI